MTPFRTTECIVVIKIPDQNPQVECPFQGIDLVICSGDFASVRHYCIVNDSAKQPATCFASGCRLNAATYGIEENGAGAFPHFFVVFVELIFVDIVYDVDYGLVVCNRHFDCSEMIAGSDSHDNTGRQNST